MGVSGYERTRPRVGFGRRRRSRVVVIAAERSRGERYLARRHDGSDHVILVAGVDDLDEVAAEAAPSVGTRRLRRRDRVEWLTGWYRGPDGDAFAATLERYAQAGGFGAARHVFDVAA